LKDPCPNEYWFLISDIQEIDTPVESKPTNEKGKYVLPNLKYREGPLYTYHFEYNGVFVSEIPAVLNKTTPVKHDDKLALLNCQAHFMKSNVDDSPAIRNLL
jgi:hypothetical protein